MPVTQAPGLRRNVFRQYFAGTTIADLTIEIINAAASGVQLELLGFKFYSLLANQVKIQRNSAAATGGTSAAGTPSRARSDTAPAATVKTYSVAKTGGATLDASWDIEELVATGDVERDQPHQAVTGLTALQGEQIGVYFSVATTVEGWIEWAEDPI